jgi:hypothetical protein
MNWVGFVRIDVKCDILLTVVASLQLEHVGEHQTHRQFLYMAGECTA